MEHGPSEFLVRRQLQESVAVPPRDAYGSFQFPYIPPGSPTTLIMVPFPLTSSAAPSESALPHAGEILIALLVASFFTVLPILCINRWLCCRCFRNCVSRHIRCYFLCSLFLNTVLMSCALAVEKNVSANDVFFVFVDLISTVLKSISTALIVLGQVGGIVVVFLLRKRIGMFFGLEHQFINADIKDLLTCFSNSRFRTIEVSVWKCEDLQPGYEGRPLYIRTCLGYNETQHSRPHDVRKGVFVCRERFQLNYDPDDDTKSLSLTVKQQDDPASAAASHFAPALGALYGLLNVRIPMTTPLHTGAMGAAVGLSVANSPGIDIARLELSAAQINRLRKTSKEAEGRTTATMASAFWQKEHFHKVDILPQGVLWLRIVDLSGA
eukprot:TRINITY_DN17627_c0_g1_i1.p1 TRINITY_DN17627_c0_g1~~TRINITY_DN17627_c0_g1_i1.p1  ORF type:complete len:398 (+),score=48.33 TRINITY_DN17627_c0_g1_i1:53-1195(+)